MSAAQRITIEVASPADSGVAGDQPDGLGDRPAPPRLRVGPVADLRPRGVAAQALQPDRAEAAVVVGVGDAPDQPGAARGELPGGLQVAQGVGTGVRAGQRDQPVPGPRRPSRPRRSGRRRTRRTAAAPARRRAARPAPAPGAAYAGRPGSSWRPSRPPASPRWSSSRRTVPSKTNPAAAATRRDAQLPAIARQRSVVRPAHVEGVVPDQPDRGAHQRPAAGSGVQAEADLGPAGLLQPQAHLRRRTGVRRRARPRRSSSSRRPSCQPVRTVAEELLGVRSA